MICKITLMIASSILKSFNSEKPEEVTEKGNPWKSYKAGLVYSVNTMKDYMNPFIDETDKEDS